MSKLKFRPSKNLRIRYYKLCHHDTVDHWLTRLNLDFAPVKVVKVGDVDFHDCIRYDIKCHGITLATLMKVNDGNPHPYVLTHLYRAIPQFERDWDTEKIRKTGISTMQILDFYWGGGLGQILTPEPSLPKLAKVRKRLIEGIDRFRRTVELSLIACQLNDNKLQFTPRQWHWIKAAHNSPRYALRRISSI